MLRLCLRGTVNKLNPRMRSVSGHSTQERPRLVAACGSHTAPCNGSQRSFIHTPALTLLRIWPEVDTFRMSFCGAPGSCSASLSEDSSRARAASTTAAAILTLSRGRRKAHAGVPPAAPTPGQHRTVPELGRETWAVFQIVSHSILQHTRLPKLWVASQTTHPIPSTVGIISPY